MDNPDLLLYLKELSGQLSEAAAHLEHSWRRCEHLTSSGSDEDDLIQFEALTSRFARLTDLLIHKFYRTIDNVEFISGGTLIDVLNRAEKRKLIDSIQAMRILKDLRNEIAHEYLPLRLRLIHQEVLEQVPVLLDLVSRALVYAKTLIANSNHS